MLYWIGNDIAFVIIDIQIKEDTENEIDSYFITAGTKTDEYEVQRLISNWTEWILRTQHGYNYILDIDYDIIENNINVRRINDIEETILTGLDLNVLTVKKIQKTIFIKVIESLKLSGFKYVEIMDLLQIGED